MLMSIRISACSAYHRSMYPMHYSLCLCIIVFLFLWVVMGSSGGAALGEPTPDRGFDNRNTVLIIDLFVKCVFNE